MRDFRYSFTLQVLAVFIATGLIATSAVASSHADNRGLRVQKNGIDMIITGANSGSLKRKNLAPDSIDKGNCPLCYHRELLKNNKHNLPKHLRQPFPGE